MIDLQTLMIALTADVTEADGQGAFMAVLLRLLREWVRRHEVLDCP